MTVKAWIMSKDFVYQPDRMTERLKVYKEQSMPIKYSHAQKVFDIIPFNTGNSTSIRCVITSKHHRLLSSY